MADHQSIHTGDEFDAGITKIKALPDFCVFEIYMTSSSAKPWQVQIVPYDTVYYRMFNFLHPFTYLDDMYIISASEYDLPGCEHWANGKAEGRTYGTCKSCDIPIDGTHVAGATYKIYVS